MCIPFVRAVDFVTISSHEGAMARLCAFDRLIYYLFKWAGTYDEMDGP